MAEMAPKEKKKKIIACTIELYFLSARRLVQKQKAFFDRLIP
jgi:hypothetical protein